MSRAGSLASSASRGAAATILGQLFRVGVQFVGVVLLARLLAPSDYGLMAAVLVLIGLGEIFRDFGLTNAAVQARTLSSAERSNLFWLNSLIGLGLAGAAVAAAPLAVLAFGDPRLQALTVVLSVTFVLNGISTQLRADLNRSLRFGRLSAAEVGGQVIGLAVAIGMAVAGFGYWSLAGQQIAAAGATLVILWIMARFRPGRYDRSTSMRRFLGFGADLVLAQLLSYAGKNTDTVVIGTMLGIGPLGYYSRAFQLLGMPLTQINAPSTKVALSVLARLQDDADRFRRYLLAGQTVMLHTMIAVLSWSGALAAPLLLLVLGPRWDPTVPLFQILAISGVFTTAGYTTYWVLVAKGLSRSQLWWQLMSRPILIAIVATGVLWGVVGVAAAYSAGSFLMWLLGLAWLHRVSDAPVAALFANAARAVVGYLVPTAAAAATAVLLPVPDPLLALLIGTAAWMGSLAIVLATWPRFRRDTSTALGLVRTLRAFRASNGLERARA